MRLLLNILPVILVERRGISGPRHPAAVIPLDRRFTRREEGSAQGGFGQLDESVPLPHDSQLHPDLPEGTEPRPRHCRNQEGDGFLRRSGTGWLVGWQST